MSFEHNVSSIGWFSNPPASGIDRAGNYHMATNVDTDLIKKKDNPADPCSIAARLSSGNVDCSTIA